MLPDGLFTEVPSIGVLGSSDAGTCIKRPPAPRRCRLSARSGQGKGSTCCGAESLCTALHAPLLALLNQAALRKVPHLTHINAKEHLVQ